MRTLKNQAAIAGIGATEFSKNSGRSELQLAAEAVRAALEDSGLKASDIDGFSSFTLDSTDDIELARAVGAKDLTFFSRVPHGGGAALGVVHHATMAVATGVAEVVVCYRSLNGRSGQRYSSGVSGDLITSDLLHWGWYMPYGLITPTSWVAMYTQRYNHDYGCTGEDLARVAIATRNYAVTNPKAFFYQKPLTMEEHQKSRWIVEPLRLYDCCQESDGGCACIITTPERARDLKQKPVMIRGVAAGSGRDQEVMTSFYKRNLAAIPEMDVVARELYKQTGLSAKDIDAGIIYDAFSSIVMWQLESFGFCKEGESKDFIREGGLDIDGRLPSNTHGGQLSEAYIHGMNGVNEGVRLARGTSVNQPKKKVENVLVTAGVGVPTSAAIFSAA